MKTIPDRIYELIILMLDGEQTPAEEGEFRQWLAESSEHQQMWQRYLNMRKKINSSRSVFPTDTEEALVKVKSIQFSRPVYRRIMRWAAIFILPLSIGLWIFYRLPVQEEAHRQFGLVAHPGGEKAILQIAGGKEMVLGSGMDSLIWNGGGAVVWLDTGSLLHYQADSLVKDKETTIHKLSIPRGGEYRLVLSDGTRIWLNSSTTLSYPLVFTGKTRQVFLEGEAFFEVAPDSLHPFIVSASGMDIRVLGTSFNVSTYQDEASFQTTLVKGKVEVSTAQGNTCVLNPGQQARLENGLIGIQEVDTRLYTSWIEGRFVFYNTTLEEISRQIARWYDTDVFFSSEQVKHIRFTGALLRFEPLEELIRMIEFTSEARFSVKGKTIVISKI